MSFLSRPLLPLLILAAIALAISRTWHTQQQHPLMEAVYTGDMLTVEEAMRDYDATREGEDIRGVQDAWNNTVLHVSQLTACVRWCMRNVWSKFGTGMSHVHMCVSGQ